jgi:hypothetical protein
MMADVDEVDVVVAHSQRLPCASAIIAVDCRSDGSFLLVMSDERVPVDC